MCFVGVVGVFVGCLIFKCNGMSDCDLSCGGPTAEHCEDVLGWSWVVHVFAVWAALGVRLGMSIIVIGRAV